MRRYHWTTFLSVAKERSHVLWNLDGKSLTDWYKGFPCAFETGVNKKGVAADKSSGFTFGMSLS